MTEEGSDSPGSGPSSARDREALRLRLYGPEGLSPEELARYERLVADARRSEHDPPATPEQGTPASVSREEARASPEPSGGEGVAPLKRRRPPWQVLLLGAVVLIGGATALVGSQLGPRSLPQTVPVPASSGTTLLYYSRASNPQSFPSAVTYEPVNYTLYFPKDRPVEVLLRCVGRGRVRIFAGTRFNFRCTDREGVQSQGTRAGVHAPFLIYGRTVGNVVWSVRVVLR